MKQRYKFISHKNNIFLFYTSKDKFLYLLTVNILYMQQIKNNINTEIVMNLKKNIDSMIIAQFGSQHKELHTYNMK